MASKYGRKIKKTPSKPQYFSEYTYAFAATYEILGEVFGNGARPLLPFFPSLRAEFDFGYDLNLPLPNQATPLCLQYKIVTPVKRVGFGSTLQQPIYRCQIHRQQNERLRSQHLQKIPVFYCAPMFYSTSEIEQHFTAGTILNNSVLVPPPKWPDHNETHRLLFDSTCTTYMCSEPRKLKKAFHFESLLAQMAEQRTDAKKLLADLYEFFSPEITDSGPGWAFFERELELINSVGDADFRSNLMAKWRYRSLRVIFALHYDLNFLMV